MSEPEQPVVSWVLTMARDPFQDGHYRAGEIKEICVKKFETPVKAGDYEPYAGYIETVHFTSRPGHLFNFKFMATERTLAWLGEELTKMFGGTS